MIGLLTLDSKIYNYGGFLQEMALFDAIEGLGYKCEIIDFDVSEEVNTFSLKRDIRNFSLRKLKKLIEKSHHQLSPQVVLAIEERKKSIDLYRKNNLFLSEQIHVDGLYEKSKSYKAIICGSDQIWNPDYNIPAFFLDFGNKNCNKVIYGASLGRDYLSKIESRKYSELLRNPDFISVREKSAQRIISRLTQKKIELVLDPTMLHDSVYWNGKLKQSNIEYSNHCFCYFLNWSEEKVKACNDFAKNNNCELITIPYLHGQQDPYQEKLNAKFVSNINPSDFLKLIKNAKCVLTDSFHAVVFSIIFERPFWCLARRVGKNSMNSRLITLLGYVDLNSRFVSERKLESLKIQSDLSFNLNKIIQMRQKSIDFLKQSINGVNRQ